MANTTSADNSTTAAATAFTAALDATTDFG